MRRSSIALVLVLALLALFAAAGCGTAAQTSAPAGADLSTQEGILEAAVTASEDMTSATGRFDMAMSFDVDPATLPAQERALVGQPIKMSGTFAASQDPMAAEFAMDFSMGGESMSLGMKMVDQKVYLSLGGQWYEAPAELMQQVGGTTGQKPDAAALEDMLEKAGIDPTAWMKDLKLVGEETVDGTLCYHLAGAPDVGKILGDVIKLTQSGAFADMMDQADTGGAMMVPPAMLPQGEELEAMMGQMASMFQDLTFDVWIAKDTLLFEKAVLNARMVPPAGEDPAGVNAVTLGATVSLDPDAAVNVTAPPSAKSLEELQKDMMKNPGLFGPLMGGLGAM